MNLSEGDFLRDGATSGSGAIAFRPDSAVKVAPARPVPPEPRPPKPLSTAAAAHLGESAAFLADPELRDLFLRLASLA